MGITRDSGSILYPLGVTPMENGVRILVQAEAEEIFLLLYQKKEEKPWKRIPFDKNERIGDVWSMTLEEETDSLLYCFEADGKKMTDPYGKVVHGNPVWGDMKHVPEVLLCSFQSGSSFDWEEDRKPEIPYSEAVFYRLHVRGFTKDASSETKSHGTFRGIMEKIPYLRELGITTVELMPSSEFAEVMMPEEYKAGPETRREPTGVLNYWGYGPSYLFSIKTSYAEDKEDPEDEFRLLVKELHKNGMECIPELYFTGMESPVMVSQILRYWILEYHVDGFHLTGFAPYSLLAGDPFLKGSKILTGNFAETGYRDRGNYPMPDTKPVSLRRKYFAEYNDTFQNDMRSFLKGDEGMISSVCFHTRTNPADHAVIHFMANTNGFTLTDAVTYDRKHNEQNGEENRDGSDYNHSWNCGLEGPTRKKKIANLRKKQLRNAMLLLFLSQGTPLLMAGDEFGNSQLGNNNAYCQDNELSWLDWKDLEKNQWLYDFTKRVIAFRKEHQVFHRPTEPRLMDTISCGRPDVSYHGEYAWKPETEAFRRELGILYWGKYGQKADGSEDDTFYVAYNMHWEPHVFGLPHLPDGSKWQVVFDTSREAVNGFYPAGEEPLLKNQNQTVIPPRSIVVLSARNTSGFYTYESPIGDLTVSCENDEVTGIHFGRVDFSKKGLKEERTRLSDRVKEELDEYFAGKRQEFDLPLAPEGTEFQKKVWEALYAIPYGETRSYQDIAEAAGDKKACRAVGMANNKNPIVIVIPCHRVIGKNGTMTGYGGGLEIKKQLLELEKENRDVTGESSPEKDS